MDWCLSRRVASVAVATLAAMGGLSFALTVPNGTAGATTVPAPVITTPSSGTSASPTFTLSGTAATTASVLVTATTLWVGSAKASGETWSVSVTLQAGTHTLRAVDLTQSGTTVTSTPVAVTVEAPTAGPSGSVIVNGSFETPYVSTVANYPSIPGWHALNSCGIEIQTHTLVDSTYPSIPAYTGRQYVELASTCVSGIAQTVATTPGTQYKLTFAYHARPNTTPTQNLMSVEWDGSVVAATLQATTTGPAANGWTVATYRVTADSSTSALVFKDTSKFTSSEGDELDAVSLVSTVVVNGGFETPPTYAHFSTHITGWTPISRSTPDGGDDCLGGSADDSATDTLELQLPTSQGITPATGMRYVELAGHCEGGVVQTVDTVPGLPYTLTFSYRAHAATPPTDNDMTVEWGTQTVVGELQGTTTGWTQATYTVIATASTEKLEFLDISPVTTATSVGDFLDDVGLSPYTQAPTLTPSSPISAPAAGATEPTPTVTVTGAGTPTGTVVVTATGRRVAKATVDAEGLWSTRATLFEGAHSLSAHEVSPGGAPGPSAAPMTVSVASNTLIENSEFKPARSVTQGGFITIAAPNSTTLPGWTVIAAPPYDSSSVGVQTNGYWNSVPATTTYFSVTLAGSYPGGISQTVSTVPGEAYEISFYSAANGDAASGLTYAFTFSVDSTSVAVVHELSQGYQTSGIGTDGRTLYWQKHTYIVTATTDTSTISFVDATPFYTYFGPVVDDVTMVPATGAVITSPLTGSSVPTPTVAVSGVATPTATVTVAATGTEPATATAKANATGTWSVSLTALKGEDTLSATQSTASGSESSPLVHITVESNTVVVNGGFETPPVTAGSHESSDTALPGWTTADGCAVELQSKTLLGVTPYTGKQDAELGDGCSGSLTQTLRTVPGQEYELTFAFRARPGTKATQNTLSVKWGTDTLKWGTPATSTLQATTTGITNGWNVAYYFVQATSTTTKLQFSDTAKTTDTTGDLLDDVSLAPYFPAKAKNTSWQSAMTQPVAATTANAATRTLAFSGEHLWYKIPVEPDEQLTVRLTNPHADDDLLLFSDITAAYQADKTPSTSSDLTALAAEQSTNTNAAGFEGAGVAGTDFGGVAGTDFGGVAGTDFGGVAGTDFGGVAGTDFGGVAGTDFGAAGLLAGGVGLEGAGVAGTDFGGVAGTDFGGVAGTDFGGVAGTDFGAAELALDQTYLGLSQQQGAVTKSVEAYTYNSSGYYYAEVIGLNGASSATAFGITVSTTDLSCGGLSLTRSVPTAKTGFPTTTGGTLSGQKATTTYKTVVLTDSQTMSTVTTGTLASDVSKLAAATDGVVVNVGKSTAVRSLTNQAKTDYTCPEALNLEADAIQNIVNSYRKGSGTNLKYVVIIGGDTVIPFFRYADQEVVEPETDFASGVSLSTATQLAAALQNDFYLTDDPYGAAATIPIDGGTSTLPLQSAAVGRLVQGASEIEKTITRFLTTKTGGVIKVSSALSAGYTFMAPPAAEISKTFAAEGLTKTQNTQLITKDTVHTTTVGTNTPWTAAQLLKKLTSKAHQLAFIGAHFSAKVMFAADHTTGKDTYLTTTAFSKDIGTDLNGSLVLSAGCHSGYSVNPAESFSGSTVAWPEAFTDAGATLIAGSGYQYSDANYVADSDEIYAELAAQLDEEQSTGTVHIGTALLETEWEYLASIEQLTGLEEKSLLEVTMYGLPMLRIQFPGGPKSAVGASTSAVGTGTLMPITTGPGKALGLDEATLPMKAKITPTMTKAFTTYGTRGYYKGADGVTSEPGAPIVPVQTEDVSVMNKTLRGVVLLHGTYTDSTGAQPLVGDPASQTAPTPPTFVSSTYTPAQIWNPNYYGTLENGSGTMLGVTPMQYLTTPTTPQKATRRTYGTLTFALFYSSTTGAAAEATAPAPASVSVTAQGTTVTVTATVPESNLAGTQEVWATYTDPGPTGAWTSARLTQTRADLNIWKATFNVPHAASTDFMVQAVNAVGEATVDNNTGAYFTPTVKGQPPATYTLAVTSAQGIYGTAATVTAKLTATTANGNAADRPITFSVGAETVTAFTGATGIAAAHVPLAGLAPGSYPLSATFAGDAADSPASATGATLTVTTAHPTLTLSVPSTLKLRSGSPSGVTATLELSGIPLGQESVYFTVNSPSGTVVASSIGTTTDKGIAQAGTLLLPAGDVGPGYTVHAYFSTSATPISATATVDAAVVGEAPVSSSGSPLTVSDATRTTLSASPDPAVFGQTVSLTATVGGSGTSTTSWPSGAAPMGKVTFYDGTTEIGSSTLVLGDGVDSASLTVHGLGGGKHTFTAKYTGNTYLLASTGSATEAVGFTTVITGVHKASVTVKSGEVLLVTGTIDGSVTVQKGGAIELENGKVSGSITSVGAEALDLCGATVHGLVTVTTSTGFVFIGGTGTGTGCAATKISGLLTLTKNKAGTQVTGSTISGGVLVLDNPDTVLQGNTVSGLFTVTFSPGPTVAGNDVAGLLTCLGNSPAPTDLGEPNKATLGLGQCTVESKL